MNGLLRIGGVAAILGGALRVANVFTAQVLSQGTLAALYLATDVFLLAGIAGLWLKRRGTLGYCAMAGLVIFVLGILTIRASAFGIRNYRLGAMVALVGLALYSVEALLRRNTALPAPVLWLIAVAAGIIAAMGVAALPMMMLAGVAFGAGFIAAGWQTLRR